MKFITFPFSWMLGVGLFCAQGISPSLRELNDSFSSVFEKVAPAVVVIESQRNPALDGLPEGLKFHFQFPDSPQGGTSQIGSGILFREDGHILTNHHVVEGVEEVVVTLRDGRKFSGRVVGGDPRSDVALVKIEGQGFPVAELGNSDEVKVGQLAFAIGTPMDLPYTFTVGVVSAKGRNLQVGGGYEFIQTDASINPGNSGGPLCNIEGQVIGINTLISGLNRGLGFSIPSNTVKLLAEQILDKGRVVRPWLGVVIAGLQEAQYLRNLFPNVRHGVVVRDIEPGAPAESSTLRQGDLIVKVDGVPVSFASDLQREILSKQIGQTVSLDVWRGGQTVRLEVKTGEQPDSFMRAAVRQNIRPPSSPTSPQPSFPGFTYEDVSSKTLKKYGLARVSPGGAIVTQVEPASPAAVAGLEPGDIICEAGGRPLQSAQHLKRLLDDVQADRGVLLILERQGNKTFAILKP